MPRLVPALFVLAAAGVAAAQPPGLPQQPQLVTAHVKKGALLYDVTEAVPVTVEREVTAVRNGVPVKEKVVVTEYQLVTKTVSLPLAGLKATDGTGRPIAADALGERLGKGRVVVLHDGRLPDAVRQVFRDDAVLVERVVTKD